MDLSRFITRKFVAATGTAVLMAVCWLVSEWLPNARDNLGTLFTALVTLVGAFITGNVVQMHFEKKDLKTKEEPVEPEPEDEDPKA